MSELPPELSPELEDQEDIRIKLNRETSKIAWHELQKFYAGGAVIAVAEGADLIDVAVRISEDDKGVVEQWLAEGVISQVNDQQAQLWYEKNTMLWALVIAPWVLVQALKSDKEH